MCPFSTFPHSQLNTNLHSTRASSYKCLLITKGSLNLYSVETLTLTEWSVFPSPVRIRHISIMCLLIWWIEKDSYVERSPQPSHPHQCHESGAIFSVCCLFLEKPPWAHSYSLVIDMIPVGRGSWNTFSLADFTYNHHKIESCWCKISTHCTWGKKSISNRIMLNHPVVMEI